MNIVLASGNQGKLSELSDLLAPEGYQVKPQSDFDVPSAAETGLTFVENALIKARQAARYTKMPAVADDSGISVDALGGEPGIYSARFAGPDSTDVANIHKLLSEMSDLPEAQRRASFYCVLVFMRHADDPTPIICQGQWSGRILTEPDGAGGFGYDPVFWCPEHGCSAAQLTRAQKNAISHRGKALQLLLEAFKNISLLK